MKPSDHRRLIVSTAGFLATAAVAWQWRWTALDALWGLWVTGLVVGVSWVIALIVATQIAATRLKSKDYSLSGALLLGSMLIFAVVFGHLTIGVFLNMFFPLNDQDTHYATTLMLVVPRYWSLILASLAVRFMRFPKHGLLHSYRHSDQANASTVNQEVDPLTAPVQGVARMAVVLFLGVGACVVMNIIRSFAPGTPDLVDRFVVTALLLGNFSSSLRKRHTFNEQPSAKALDPRTSLQGLVEHLVRFRQDITVITRLSGEDLESHGMVEAARYKLATPGGSRELVLAKFESMGAIQQFPRHMRNDAGRTRDNGLFMLGLESGRIPATLVAAFDSL